MAYTVSDIKIGDIVRFTSIANNDDNIYYGKIISKCSYELAKSYSDIVTMYNNISIYLQGEVPDIEELNYILIKLMDSNNEDKYIIAFAIEWIDTITLIEAENKMLITVYEAGESDKNNILSALKDAGYIAKVEKIY